MADYKSEWAADRARAEAVMSADQRQREQDALAWRQKAEPLIQIMIDTLGLLEGVANEMGWCDGKGWTGLLCDRRKQLEPELRALLENR